MTDMIYFRGCACGPIEGEDIHPNHLGKCTIGSCTCFVKFAEVTTY